MSNGKGSGRRQFDRKRERAYKTGHTDTFGEHEKVDGRKTKIVIREGQLIHADELTRDGKVFSIPVPPNDYMAELDDLKGRLLSKFIAPGLSVSAKVLGVK